MYRAEVEPMPENPEGRVPYTGLWKVVIYDDKGEFVRNDKEYISFFETKRLAEQLNDWLNNEPWSQGQRSRINGHGKNAATDYREIDFHFAFSPKT
jgi:hypothetical protein